MAFVDILRASFKLATKKGKISVLCCFFKVQTLQRCGLNFVDGLYPRDQSRLVNTHLIALNFSQRLQRYFWRELAFGKFEPLVHHAVDDQVQETSKRMRLIL